MAVDSREEQLTEDQIVTMAALETATDYAPEVVLAMFKREIQSPRAKVLRYGNTLFVIHGAKTADNKGTFRALNADVAENYVESGRKFVVDAYDMGYDILVTEFYDESILQIFRTISKNPPNVGMGYSAVRKKDGEFRVTLKLGDLRKG